VCLGCYAHLADVAGVCPACEVDLLPIDDPAVRDELRAEAERRFSHKAYAEFFSLILLAIALWLPIVVFTPGAFRIFAALALPLSWKGVSKTWSLVQPDSAMQLYQARRERLKTAEQPKLLPAHEAQKGRGDPEALDIDGTVRWLGIDEPTR
jgi:hypothetical protein